MKIFILLFISLILTIIFFSDPKDTCLDSGYCKAGVSVNIEAKEITVNEQNCKENNGIWYTDKKVCQFR